MTTQLDLGEIDVEVVRKDIKNVHLSVHPPTGRVRIAAPTRMESEAIRLFAISKLAWIKQQQRNMREQDRELPRNYVERETHYVWGKPHLLTVAEEPKSPLVEIKHKRMLLRVRPGTKLEKTPGRCRRVVSRAAPPACRKIHCHLGAKAGRPCRRRLHPANEDEVGKLQLRCSKYSVEYWSRTEARSMLGIHRRSRDDPHLGTDAQPTVSSLDPTTSPRLGTPSASFKRPASSTRRLVVLIEFDLRTHCGLEALPQRYSPPLLSYPLFSDL